jgi:hypothetical protein
MLNIEKIEIPKIEIFKDHYNVKKVIEKLNYFRHWNNKLSKDIMHSDLNGEKQLKVRKIWWQRVTMELDMLANEKNILSSELKDEVNDFIKKYCSTDFGMRLTEKEDIKKADQVINDVLMELCENL